MAQACDVYCYGNRKLDVDMVEHLILRQDGELGIGASEVRKIMVFGDQSIFYLDQQ